MQIWSDYEFSRSLIGARLMQIFVLVRIQKRAPKLSKIHGFEPETAGWKAQTNPLMRQTFYHYAVAPLTTDVHRPLHPEWLDLSKIRRLGNILKVFGIFWGVIEYLAIWSHCSYPFPFSFSLSQSVVRKILSQFMTKVVTPPSLLLHLKVPLRWQYKRSWLD